MGNLILKILAGQQAGAEVILEYGEYSLGSGKDDDLHVADLSVSEQHLRLNLQNNKIEILAHSGDILTAKGLSLSSGQSEWVEIEPLDVVIIGTVKFAIGARNAQWATLQHALRSQDQDEPEDNEDKAPSTKGTQASLIRFANQMKSQSTRLAAGAAIIGLIAGTVYLVGNSLFVASSANALINGNIEDVRAALSELPFSDRLKLHEAVDDQIYLSGYVDKPVQRRAVVSAIEESNAPVHLRIRVLETLRKDVAATLQSRGSNVDFSISDSGVLSLSGSILNKTEADQLIATLREINGLARIDSNIRSADDYLKEIQQLARRAFIDDTIIFRLDGDVLEVSGVITSQDVDRWSGFLRSYSNQYARYIPLRSLVKLVQENGDVIDLVSNIDGSASSETLIEDRQTEVLKLARAVKEQVSQLPQASARTEEPEADDTQANVSQNDAITDLEKAVTRLSAKSEKVSFSEINAENSVAETLIGTGGTYSPAVLTETVLADDPQVLQAAEVVLLAWQQVSVGEPASEEVKEKFLPLLLRSSYPGKICSDTLNVPAEQISVAVFWLDILSGTEELGLDSLSQEMQRLVLEAAISPNATRRCLEQNSDPSGLKLAVSSRFLQESLNNPNFVRFLTRDLKTPSLEISGASLSDDPYVQSKDNKRYRTGQSTSSSSRLLAIGELGALLKEYDGYSVALWSKTTAWVVNSN